MSKRTYYKAVRPDGSSFHDPAFKWSTEPGGITEHPTFNLADVREGRAGGYLSVATVPTDCTGFLWPCRLLEVEPVGRVYTPDLDGLPNKRAGRAFRTVREMPAHEVFGPQGEHVVALFDRAGSLTGDEAREMDAAWDASRDASRDAAWYAAWDASWDASRDAARYAARYASWGAAEVLIVRDLIGQYSFTQEHYDMLTRPWRTVIGPIHPDDPAL